MTFRLAALSSLALVIAMGFAWAAEPAPNPLVKAARERQVRYDRVELTYQIREAPVRHPEIAMESTSRLTLSGNKARSEYRRQQLNPADQKVVEDVTFSTVDEKTSKSWETFPTISGTPTGVIQKGADYGMLHFAETEVLLQFLRGDDERMAIRPLREFADTGRTKQLGDSICHEYRATTVYSEPYGLTPTSIWCDPAKQFNIVRIMHGPPDRPHFACQIRYRLEGEHWIPDLWRYMCFLEGFLFRDYEVSVTKFEFGIPIPTERFDLDFPLGCEVRSVGEDGQFETPETVPGTAASDARNLPWPQIAIGAVLAILLFSMLYRLLRARRQTGRSASGLPHPDTD